MKKIGIGFVVAGLVVIALLARDRLANGEAMAAPASSAVATGSAPEPDAPGPRSSVNAASVDGMTRTADAAPGAPDETESAPDAMRERTPEGALSPDAVAADERPVQPGAAQEPDPETILRRVAEAYADVRALQADFVQRLENPLLGSEAVSRGTIYQRGSDRFLMRFEEPEGDVIVGDGQYFWIYYPSVNEDQVVRMPMERGAAGGVDLRSQFLGDPLERFDPTLRGTDEAAGREAHVLRLEPKGPAGYDWLQVWVDAEDDLVRRFTVAEANGNVRRIRLRNLTVNPTLPDSLFEFTPPEGARIIDRG